MAETMESKAIQRRLAAILAGDVVGYSRLMGGDEVGTLSSLKTHRRELTDPVIAAHRGRIVKTTGDGPDPRLKGSDSGQSGSEAVDSSFVLGGWEVSPAGCGGENDGAAGFRDR